MVAFSSLAGVLGECSTSHSPQALFFTYKKMEISIAHYFHSLGQDQSTEAERAEATVAQCSRTSCV